MANKISTEILIIILNNVQATQDLYSSLLVNRIWCKVTIPILWKSTFNQECHDEKKSKKEALCIRTYISCLDTQARTLLTQNGFDLSSSPPRATFDYPSFIHKFSISNFVYFISIYSQQIFDKHFYNNNDSTVTQSRILYCEICKLIINRCTFLDHIEVRSIPKISSIKFLNSDLIGSILKLPGAPEIFKKLESFTSSTSIIGDDDELICPLYESLTLICHNILNMNLCLNSYFQVQLFSKLISVQKRLENLSINAYSFLDCNSIFWAIISQKETLKRLHLKSVRFYNINGISSPIGQIISLEQLYFRDCYGLHKSFVASSFTQLSIFRYRHSRYEFFEYSQEFIKEILETANTNLKNLCLDLHPTIAFDIFSTILNYCTKVTELSLNELSPEQVIELFNNNFNELRRFSFDCGREIFDADELLCQMAKNVPESLETIKIKMDCDNPWIFSADSLRKFFEGWCCKRGKGNKKIIVKNKNTIERNQKGTEQARLFTLNDDHFKVIKEYGVQFDLEE